LKTVIADEKLAHDQELHELRVKAQLEDNQRRKELEDRVRILQASKDDLVMESNKMNAKIVDHQQKIASQSLEIETLKRNNESVRNVSRVETFLKILMIINLFFIFLL
jgi:hypothetical protein